MEMSTGETILCMRDLDLWTQAMVKHPRAMLLLAVFRRLLLGKCWNKDNAQGRETDKKKQRHRGSGWRKMAYMKGDWKPTAETKNT